MFIGIRALLFFILTIAYISPAQGSTIFTSTIVPIVSGAALGISCGNACKAAIAHENDSEYKRDEHLLLALRALILAGGIIGLTRLFDGPLDKNTIAILQMYCAAMKIGGLLYGCWNILDLAIQPDNEYLAHKRFTGAFLSLLAAAGAYTGEGMINGTIQNPFKNVRFTFGVYMNIDPFFNWLFRRRKQSRAQYA